VVVAAAATDNSGMNPAAAVAVADVAPAVAVAVAVVAARCRSSTADSVAVVDSVTTFATKFDQYLHY